MTMEERKAKGLLWTDTEEAMAAQRKARGLCYDFNHIQDALEDSIERKAEVVKAVIRIGR